MLRKSPKVLRRASRRPRVTRVRLAMSTVAIVDIGLRDVDASGAVLWNKPRFVAASSGHHRGVEIGADHPIFSFYSGDTVARPFRLKLTAPCPSAGGWTFVGSIGLHLAHDQRNGFTISVEAATLLQLLGAKEGGAEAMEALAPTWHDGMCFCAAFRGWRGAISEYRFWSALFHHILPQDVPTPKIEAHLPIVRGWYTAALLEDFVRCIGSARAAALLAMVAANEYDGAPDLVLWNGKGELEFIEVRHVTQCARVCAGRGARLR